MLVVRAEDCAFAVHDEVAPRDAIDMVEIILPEAMAKLEAQRLEAKARKKHKQMVPKEGV